MHQIIPTIGLGQYTLLYRVELYDRPHGHWSIHEEVAYCPLCHCTESGDVCDDPDAHRRMWVIDNQSRQLALR